MTLVGLIISCSKVRTESGVEQSSQNQDVNFEKQSWPLGNFMRPGDKISYLRTELAKAILEMEVGNRQEIIGLANNYLDQLILLKRSQYSGFDRSDYNALLNLWIDGKVSQPSTTSNQYFRIPFALIELDKVDVELMLLKKQYGRSSDNSSVFNDAITQEKKGIESLVLESSIQSSNRENLESLLNQHSLLLKLIGQQLSEMKQISIENPSFDKSADYYRAVCKASHNALQKYNSKIGLFGTPLKSSYTDIGNMIRISVACKNFLKN